MKRAPLIVISVILLVSLLVIVNITADAGTPVGTPVTNEQEFLEMSADGQYYLADNISLTQTYVGVFTGTLDGNGKTITTVAPIFNKVEGTVKNLTIDGTIDLSAIEGDAGALAKRANNATFENITNSAAVKGYKTTYIENEKATMASAGGIVGTATGNCVFKNITNEGDINGYNAAGIVGMLNLSDNDVVSFINCENNGSITATGTEIHGNAKIVEGVLEDPLFPGAMNGIYMGTGGITGLILRGNTVNFTDCTNNGVVDNSQVVMSANSGNNNLYATAGGIYGAATYNTADAEPNVILNMTNCSNKAAIKGTRQTGGLVGWVGYVYLNASNCSNEGSVGTTTSYAGGLFGRGSEYSYIITDCENKGTVKSVESQAGGIIGYSYPSLSAEIIRCINYADIDSDYTTVAINIGGIVGSNGNATTEKFLIEDCRNEGNISAPNNMAAGIIANCGVKANVVIKNCINTGDITGKAKVGGIVAERNANVGMLIDNCINEGKIQALAGASGGIISNITQLGGTISNCINRGTVYGTAQVGGIVGYASQVIDIDNCLNDTGATISASTDGYCAGIISRIGTDTIAEEVSRITNCVNKGEIISGKDQAAGILAFTRRVNYFENCYNYGKITSPGHAGGILGNNANYYAEFKNCYNFGNIKAGDGKRAAGIAASVGSSTAFNNTYLFENCGNEGRIEGGQYTSGIVGYLYGTTGRNVTVQYCYNIGEIVANTGDATGFVGYINGVKDITCRYNYNAGQMTAPNGKTYATVYNNHSSASVDSLYSNYIKNGIADYLTFRNGTTPADVAFPQDFGFYITDGDLSSGKLAYALNTDAGKNVFYQNLGEDTHPVPDSTHKVVLYDATNGVYYNLNEEETTPGATTPSETTPAATTPAATTPAATTPAATTPAYTLPPVPTTPVTTPSVTTPSTTPAATTPAATTPAVTTPAVTTPAVTTPAGTAPAVTTPSETTPAETTPSATTPVITQTDSATDLPNETSGSDGKTKNCKSTVSFALLACLIPAAAVVGKKKD